MKPDEIKLRVRNYANELIDDLFPNTDLFNKLKAATAKFWVDQNIWKLDEILSQFVDCNGDIDTVSASKIYSETLFDATGRFSMDIRTLVNNQTLNRYLPDSVVLFTKDDLNTIFGINM